MLVSGLRWHIHRWSMASHPAHLVNHGGLYILSTSSLAMADQRACMHRVWRRPWRCSWHVMCSSLVAGMLPSVPVTVMCRLLVVIVCSGPHHPVSLCQIMKKCPAHAATASDCCGQSTHLQVHCCWGSGANKCTQRLLSIPLVCSPAASQVLRPFYHGLCCGAADMLP